MRNSYNLRTEFLGVPKVNRELWVNSNMKKETMGNDRKFQMSQLCLSRGLVPLVKLMDILLKSENRGD